MHYFVSPFYKSVGTRTTLKLLQRVRYLNVTLQLPKLFSTTISKNTIHKSLYEQSIVTGVTVPEFFWSKLHKWENADAFTCGFTGQKKTHGQVYTESRGFGAALLQSGLKRRDVVAIFAPNMPEYPIAAMGIMDVGLVATTVNATYTADEVARHLIHSEAKVVVTIPQLVPIVEKAKETCPLVQKIIVMGLTSDAEVPSGCHSFREMTNVNWKMGVPFLKGSEVDTREEIAFMPYSSGTTGWPKGVMLTHAGVITNALQICHPEFNAGEPFENGNEQFRLVSILPFSHVAGITVQMLNVLQKGMSTVTFLKFDPNVFLQQIKSHKPKGLFLVPPLIHFLIQHPDITAKELSIVDVIGGGGASVGKAVIQKLREKAGRDLFFMEVYGMTELTTFATLLPRSASLDKIGSCGMLIPGTEGKIIDTETGEIVTGDKESGEICIRGPQKMKGYLKNEEATREMISDDGWVRTGDVGYFDSENYLYIVDRIKELIKVKALQVSPSELEGILRKHPLVMDVAVIGVPDERSGEAPRAFIIKKPDSDLTEKSIHDFLEDKIAPHKKITGGIAFVQAIPKTLSGKILRRQLKQEYMQSIK